MLSSVMVKSLVCQQCVKSSMDLYTFDLFLLNIPMQLQSPTMYRLRFQPLWSPDTGWNLTTSKWSFHFPPFTSIQLIIIPRNDPFVLSAVHSSAVNRIPP